jgi:hypothetical protein
MSALRAVWVCKAGFPLGSSNARSTIHVEVAAGAGNGGPSAYEWTISNTRNRGQQRTMLYLPSSFLKARQVGPPARQLCPLHWQPCWAAP